LVAGAFALLALTGGTAVAQGNGNGRGRENAPGQVKKADRQYQARFADHDREFANTWYAQNRRSLPRGMRDRDRVPAEQQARFAPGYVFDRNMRGYVYPAPYSLRRHFAPAPRGYRYVIYGGHVMLVDDGYRVFDTISLNINLGG
jgi:Ni/Co efflux regulator RcnB